MKVVESIKFKINKYFYISEVTYEFTPYSYFVILSVKMRKHNEKYFDMYFHKTAGRIGEYEINEPFDEIINVASDSYAYNMFMRNEDIDIVKLKVVEQMSLIKLLMEGADEMCRHV
ncbi:MAG: hypothetical protein ACRCX8_20065 [Sarcina sp.]